MGVKELGQFKETFLNANITSFGGINAKHCN